MCFKLFFFVHVFKLSFRQKLDDHAWKDVFVEYKNSNFWTIYNSFIKRTQFVRNVHFDELQTYYADKSESFDDLIDISKLLKHWTANNDDFLNDLKWNNFFEENSTNNIANNVFNENNNDSNEQNKKKMLTMKLIICSITFCPLNLHFHQFLLTSCPVLMINHFMIKTYWLLLLLFFQFFLFLLVTGLLEINHLIFFLFKLQMIEFYWMMKFSHDQNV